MYSVQHSKRTASSPLFRPTWALVRLVMAAVLCAAIVSQVANTTRYAREQGYDLVAVLSNHFSYFTVLSTMLGAIALVVSGIWLWRARRSVEIEPRWISILMLCIGSAMVITGIVYNILLRNGTPEPDTLVWASEIKHVVAPLVFACDLALNVGRSAYRWSDIPVVLVYPVVWACYTLVRGDLVSDPETGAAWWYPYGFLDPHRAAGGYFGVMLYVIGIALALALIATLAVWGSRRLRGTRTR